MFLVETKTGVRTLVENYPTDLSDVLFVAPFIDGCDSLEHFWAQSIVKELDRIKKETPNEYVDKAMVMLSLCMADQQSFWEAYQYEDPDDPFGIGNYCKTPEEVMDYFLGVGHVRESVKPALFNYGVDCIADLYKDPESLDFYLEMAPELAKLCKERLQFLDI